MATATYTFEADTPGALPANVTVVRGGTVTAFDSGAMASRVLRQHGNNANIDARLTLITAHTDIDVDFKIFTPDDLGIARREAVVVFTNTNMDVGYLVQWDDLTDNRIEIFRRDAGSPYTHTLLANTASLPTTTNFTWRVTATVSLGVTTITVYSWNGSSFVQQLQTTDSTYTQGLFGVSQLGITGGTSALYDDFNATFTPVSTDTITIETPKTFQTFQRTSGIASIPITGTYTGTPTAIEASFNGGAFSTIDASPTGGNFSGTLSNQTQGQGVLTVRWTNDTSVNNSVTNIGIGDIFVIAGQSNASGRGTNNQSYSHGSLKGSMFGNDDVWKDLTDPTDRNNSQVDAVSSDADAAGSPWPLVTTNFLADQSVPIAFVPCAKGATEIADWARNGADPDDPTTLYGSMLRRINAIGGSITAVLWHQGESDVNNNQSRSAHNAALDTLQSNLNTDVGSGTKLVVCQIGYKTTGPLSGDALRNAIDAVRAAQKDAWEDNSNILFGPTLYDVGPLADGVHFQTNTEISTLATRWWLALQQHFYSGSNGRGPELSSAIINEAKTEITLTFNKSLLPASGMSTTQFRVKEAGTPLTVSTVTRPTTTTILLTLSAPAGAGNLTLDIGSGNDSAGNTIVTDSNGLPADTELAFAVQGVSTTSFVIGNSSAFRALRRRI